MPGLSDFFNNAVTHQGFLAGLIMIYDWQGVVLAEGDSRCLKLDMPRCPRGMNCFFGELF
jgi:hypothetical protein